MIKICMILLISFPSFAEDHGSMIILGAGASTALSLSSKGVKAQYHADMAKQAQEQMLSDTREQVTKITKRIEALNRKKLATPGDIEEFQLEQRKLKRVIEYGYPESHHLQVSAHRHATKAKHFRRLSGISSIAGLGLSFLWEAVNRSNVPLEEVTNPKIDKEKTFVAAPSLFSEKPSTARN